MSLPIELELPEISTNELYTTLSLQKQMTNTQKIKIILNSKQLEEFFEKKSQNPTFVYFARVGGRFDGHSLVKKVLHLNNIFVGSFKHLQKNKDKLKLNDSDLTEIQSNNFFIDVENIEIAIQQTLEQTFQLNPMHFKTIGITGTNGKTSVAQICSQIIENLTKKLSLRIGTLGLQVGNDSIAGSHVTTPDYPSLLNIINYIRKKNIENIIMEVTSHGLQENRLGNWKIDIGVFTNLTQDHLDFHGSMENYKIAKQKMFSHYLKELGTAVICTNNLEWPSFVESAKAKSHTLLGVGYGDEANLFIEKYKDHFKSVSFLGLTEKRISLNGISGTLTLTDFNLHKQQCKLSSNLLGEFQFDNIMCAIGCVLALGFSLQEIEPNLKELKNIPGRLEAVKAIDSNDVKYPTFLIDYAHSPDALEKTLKVCRDILTQEKKGKLITVFGCGGNRDASKRPMMGKIAYELSDVVIVTTDNPRKEDPNKIIDDIFMGMPNHKKCYREVDRKNAIALAYQLSQQYDLILVAGKGHEDYQIIGDTKYPFSDYIEAQKMFTKEKVKR